MTLDDDGSNCLEVLSKLTIWNYNLLKREDSTNIIHSLNGNILYGKVNICPEEEFSAKKLIHIKKLLLKEYLKKQFKGKGNVNKVGIVGWTDNEKQKLISNLAVTSANAMAVSTYNIEYKALKTTYDTISQQTKKVETKIKTKAMKALMKLMAKLDQ